LSNYKLINSDCLEAMRNMADASVDAIVTDPPYELGFMGKSWDNAGIAYNVDLWREALRVLKPGGHLLSFGGTRTYHRMACAIEDAGFEVRDSIHWVCGSGFPKSLDVSKAIDKAAGARGHEGKNTRTDGGVGTASYRPTIDPRNYVRPAPITAAAQAWDGWGTALKPAHEPVVVARKPLVGTVAANVLAHGTGALNIDGCRVGTDGGTRKSGPPSMRPGTSLAGSVTGVSNGGGQEPIDGGRWPPNILLSHTPECGEACAEDCAVAEMDGQSGGASRFFPVFRYQAKASRSERERGLNEGQKATHPTVKPVELMRWLVRLVTPRGGVVLDPFTGSGTTGVAAMLEGFRFIGIEREPEYFRICEARVESAQPKVEVQAELFA
jgi:site-specific DNA-methyltransferase (adenine-specific)